MESLLEPYISISLSITAIFFLTFLFLFLTHSSTPHTQTPSPSSYPLVGNLPAFLCNHRRFHDWVSDMLSATPTQTLIVHGFLSSSHGVATSNPLNIKHILHANFSNYVKGSRFRDFLYDLLGNGIFIADADLWWSQRKLASFEFNAGSLRAFVDRTVQLEITSRLIPTLGGACARGEVIDLQDVLKRFAFDNICKLAFGDDPCCLDSNTKYKDSTNSSSSFVNAFDEAVEICSSRSMSPVHSIWKIKRFLNIGSERRLRRAIEVIDDYAMKIIEKKEAAGRESGGEDLLSRFASCDDRFEIRDEEQKHKFLRDIIISFVLAGKDSTSTALTWFFWLISADSACQTKIYNELTTLVQVRSGIFSYDDLKQLNYLHAAVSESLRLFPPIPINTRLTVNDDILPDGTPVKAGWFADYSAYAVGRNESVWGEDCREFRPERWLDEKGAFRSVDPFRFPVFHGGPRMCLGKEMAYVQMKSIAASIIYGFVIDAVDGGSDAEKMKNPPYVLSLVLKMKGGLRVRLKKRS